MKVLVRCVGLASGEEHPDIGKLLKSYDLDTGEVIWTDDPAEAMEFASMSDALDLRNAKLGLPPRPDGHPDRPLTAYHLALEAQAAEFKGVSRILADKKQG